MRAPPTCLATGDTIRRGMEYHFNNMAPLRVADVLYYLIWRRSSTVLTLEIKKKSQGSSENCSKTSFLKNCQAVVNYNYYQILFILTKAFLLSIS